MIKHKNVYLRSISSKHKHDVGLVYEIELAIQMYRKRGQAPGLRGWAGNILPKSDPQEGESQTKNFLGGYPRQLLDGRPRMDHLCICRYVSCNF